MLLAKQCDSVNSNVAHERNQPSVETLVESHIGYAVAKHSSPHKLV